MRVPDWYILKMKKEEAFKTNFLVEVKGMEGGNCTTGVGFSPFLATFSR
jgi:hypothetical protein